MPLVSQCGNETMDFFAASALTSAMKSCERLPSDHVSQCRTKSLSYSFPLAFAEAGLASFDAHNCAAQSGDTSIDIAIFLPSGDSLKLLMSTLYGAIRSGASSDFALPLRR